MSGHEQQQQGGFGFSDSPDRDDIKADRSDDEEMTSEDKEALRQQRRQQQMAAYHQQQALFNMLRMVGGGMMGGGMMGRGGLRRMRGGPFML